MRLEGEKTFNAPRDTVWRVLNSPERVPPVLMNGLRLVGRGIQISIGEEFGLTSEQAVPKNEQLVTKVHFSWNKLVMNAS